MKKTLRERQDGEATEFAMALEIYQGVWTHNARDCRETKERQRALPSVIDKMLSEGWLLAPEGWIIIAEFVPQPPLPPVPSQ